MLKDNFDKVNANIQAACDRAGRNREDVTLIAVSKTKPIQMLQEAYDLVYAFLARIKFRRL